MSTVITASRLYHRRPRRPLAAVLHDHLSARLIRLAEAQDGPTTRTGSHGHVARLLGEHRATWSRWVAGESTPPVERVERWAVGTEVRITFDAADGWQVEDR